MDIMETKMSGTSRRIAQLLKIGSFVMLTVTALAAVAIGILFLSDKATKASFLTAFIITSDNGMTLQITPQHLFVLFTFMAVYSVCMCIVLYSTHMIFKDASEEGTPFNRKHVVRIKRIAFMVIGLSIFGNFSEGVFDLFTLNELTWHIDFSGIILGIVIYCLALFFDYGCELQQQSDETL